MRSSLPPTAPSDADVIATYRRILEAIHEYVYVIELGEGSDYAVHFKGPCRGHFLGMSDAAAAAETWRDHVHPEDRELFDVVHGTVRRLGRLDVEYRLLGEDGSSRWVRDRGVLREEDGRTFIDGSVLETTDAHAIQQRLVSARNEASVLAATDELTGLANRRALPTALEAGRHVPLAYLHLDVDRFKAVNDAHGHQAGDEVLRAVGERLRAAVRPGDAAIRMGGEEFLLVLRGVESMDQLLPRAEALLNGFRHAPVVVGDVTVPVTVSAGAALAPQGWQDVDAVLRTTDAALYRAKREGRDRVVAAEPLPA